MDSHIKLLTELLDSADMRKTCSHLHLPEDPEELQNTKIFHILEQMWPILREISDSDEECTEKVESLVYLTDFLHEHGRI